MGNKINLAYGTKDYARCSYFGRDMMFDIPYIADWTDIGKRRQALVDQNNARENKRRIDFDYAVGITPWDRKSF